MKSSNPPSACPVCGTPILADSPGGLCPACVMLGASNPSDGGRGTEGRTTPPSLAEVGAAFPQLEVLRLLGCGGMGFVYLVRQTVPAREAAVKILPKTLAANPSFVERFNRECRTLARLNHPNIVRVYDSGQSGGFCYLMMEFVDGANLRQAMRAGRFTPEQALDIIPWICDALQYAHSQGVLHRDIKPENILLDAEGKVKIADFGVAKLLDEAGIQPEGTLTQTGLRLGTPHYMAPEQVERPADVDHRADIYSLGVVFYELLTGELPLGRFPAPSTKAYVDARIDEIVFRALAKERELRQQNAGDVRTEIEGVAATPSNPPPPHALRTDHAYISTPRRLKTLAGLRYIYAGSGELSLKQDQLIYRSSNTGTATVIPLEAIRGISLGKYPWVAKPAALHYLAVSFERGGVKDTLLFTPYRSNWDPTWTTNKVVAEWLQSLREAFRSATGRPPAEVADADLEGPSRTRRLASVLLWPILVATAIAILRAPRILAFESRGGPGKLIFVVLGGVVLLFAGLWMARRARRRPPEPGGPASTGGRAWTAGSGALFLCAAVAFLLASRNPGPDQSNPPPPAAQLEPAGGADLTNGAFQLQRTWQGRITTSPGQAAAQEWDVWTADPYFVTVFAGGRRSPPALTTVRPGARGFLQQLRVEYTLAGDRPGVLATVRLGTAEPVVSVLIPGDPEAVMSAALQPVPGVSGLGRIRGQVGEATAFAYGGRDPMEIRVDRDPDRAAQPRGEAADTGGKRAPGPSAPGWPAGVSGPAEPTGPNPR